MEVAMANAELPQAASWQARCIAALTIAVAFYVIGHSFRHSRTVQEDLGRSAARKENPYAAQQSDTTTSSAIGFFMLGGMGAVLLMGSPPRSISLRHPLLLLCLVYVGWCFISWLWSVDPMQSFRKLAILGLMLAGAVGLASRFDLEDLVWIVLLTVTGLIVVGVLAELAYGTFRPWRSDYRFAGTCHPNDQGLQCALLAIAAALAAWEGRDRPWLRRALVALGIIGLILSKSRTTLVSFLAVAALGIVLRFHGMQRWLVAAACVTVLCAAGIAASFSSIAALDQTATIAAMGRTQNISSLTGRVPLWQELWKAAGDRLFTGSGFGAFWTEKSVLKYSDMFGWHIPHAHNSYLDMLLAVGLIGLLIHFTSFFATTAVALRRYDEHRRPAELFVVCYLALSLVHGLSESKLPGLGMAGFFLLTVMAMIAVRAPLDRQPAFAEAAAVVGRQSARGGFERRQRTPVRSPRTTWRRGDAPGVS